MIYHNNCFEVCLSEIFLPLILIQWRVDVSSETPQSIEHGLRPRSESIDEDKRVESLSPYGRSPVGREQTKRVEEEITTS